MDSLLSLMHKVSDLYTTEFEADDQKYNLYIYDTSGVEGADVSLQTDKAKVMTVLMMLVLLLVMELRALDSFAINKDDSFAALVVMHTLTLQVCILVFDIGSKASFDRMIEFRNKVFILFFHRFFRLDLADSWPTACCSRWHKG